MRKLSSLLVVSLLALLGPLVNPASAHRSGCHRWHSCPSDSDSYSCGDLGYSCQYPSYSESGDSSRATRSAANNYPSSPPTTGYVRFPATTNVEGELTAAEWKQVLDDLFEGRMSDTQFEQLLAQQDALADGDAQRKVKAKEHPGQEHGGLSWNEDTDLLVLVVPLGFAVLYGASLVSGRIKCRDRSRSNKRRGADVRD